MALLDLKAKAAAWWSAWKWVALLALVLAASLWGNLQQYVASRTAPLRQEVRELREANAITARIADQAGRDNAQLLAHLSGLVERGRQTRVVYRQAAAAQPLAANCAPGRARMDAVNAGADP